MSTTQQIPHEVRRATRSSQESVVGGVAAGLAAHLALPVLWVRAGFVLLAALGGLGIAFYAGLWMVLPTDARFGDEAPGLASATRTGKRTGRVRRISDLGPVVALGALGLGFVFGVEAVFGRGALFWPLALGVGGIALLWRQADEAQRERWLDTTGRADPFRTIFGRGGWAAYVRVGSGLLLVLVALVLVSLESGGAALAGEMLVAGLLGVVGLALALGPWIFRLAGDLTSERAERIRSQERADMAAHLHDSVLQTLALIQKNSTDATAVARLARSQERDLRAWLYADDSLDDSSVASALRSAAAEVEDVHGIVVDVVNVGDRGLTEGLRPIVLAAREAMVNAAKHAGVPRVDVFAEINAAGADVFVRDRGVGFDASTIAEDRYGVRRSILDRMERHGGTAEVRSSPGEGTEVRLHMTSDEGDE